MGGIAQKVVGHCRDVWPRAEFDNRVPIVEILIVFQRQKNTPDTKVARAVAKGMNLALVHVGV